VKGRMGKRGEDHEGRGMHPTLGGRRGSDVEVVIIKS